MALPDEDIADNARKAISKAMHELLEIRHLYQHVHVDLSEIKKFIASSNPEKLRSVMFPGGIAHTPQKAHRELLEKKLLNITDVNWHFDLEDRSAAVMPDAQVTHFGRQAGLPFKLPTIKINCSNCDAVKPAHNSGYKEMLDAPPDLNFLITKNEQPIIVQIFTFPYLCQSCKREPLVLMVRREGLKLQLVGRSHFERFDVPKYIPKQESEFFSEALIAHNAGRALAGLFFLRVFIEQYMRRVTAKQDALITGDALADAYSKMLDPDFPKRFKTLKTIYEELSVCLHSAKADEKKFAENLTAVDGHFKLLESIPLKDTS